MAKIIMTSRSFLIQWAIWATCLFVIAIACYYGVFQERWQLGFYILLFAITFILSLAWLLE